MHASITVARSRDKMLALKEHVAEQQSRVGASRAGARDGEIISATADLGDLSEIANLTDRLQRKTKLDVLINNVGILNNQHKTSAQGFELSYAVNLLGQYLLTERLLQSGVLNKSGLIISMASGGLYNQPLNTRLLDQPDHRFDGLMAYASHKRAQLALTDYWRRHGDNRELFAYTMHPGWVKTSGVKTSLPGFNTILKPILRTAEQAADTCLWLAQKRPGTRENVVWFDRKARTAHKFRSTRTPRVTIDELVSYLNEDLQKVGYGL